MNVITLKSISKSFSLTNRHPFLVRQLFTKSRVQKLAALKDISLTIKKGESVGIIGENGSGKSTLLKIINGITFPDTGKVEIQGKICSLIELGAGFHPDLTGRENVFLNGILLGFSKNELKKIYNNIVTFADIGEYINQPIRTYSTGMTLRLGFAVAAHLQPDILIVDEVLAVGDEQFQRKCLDKIEELRQKNCTIIFVSHNLPLIEAFSDRVIWIKDGAIKQIGMPAKVVSSYLKYVDSKDRDNLVSLSPNETAPIFIKEVKIINSQDKVTQKLKVGEKARFEIYYKTNQKIHSPVFGIIIHNQLGLPLHWSNTRMTKTDLKEVLTEGKIVYQVNQLLLLPGRYLISVGIHNYKETQIFDWKNRVINFDIIGSDTGQGGYLGLPSNWLI